MFNQFLLCGDPNQRLTLFKCPECNISLAVPFSCKTRICPSCKWPGAATGSLVMRTAAWLRD
ncbi:MAG: transposase zinc-binding domain-containing protein [Armatimonadetes bacterium]|nr:transposase zinc-binding domain-containing protein [Armatimonadota bacterium]